MSYTDESFWDQYGEYLKESQERHARMLLPVTKRVHEVLDLGCGQYASAYDLMFPVLVSYTGVDEYNPGARSGCHKSSFIQANYRDKLPNVIEPTLFTSLFSAEATAPEPENRELYEQVFAKYPTIDMGVVSGFYYRSQLGQETVGESGGIQSYQTHPEMPEPSQVYSEERTIVEAPSKMFGPDVVEVWRFLRRRN